MSDEEISAIWESVTRGHPHERYCTLCGIPFSFYEHRRTRGIEDDYRDAYWASRQDPKILFDRGDRHDYFVWSSYFLTLRIPKVVNASGSIVPDCEVRLSGIGQHDQRKGRIPPPGYDIRNILRGRKQVAQMRLLMNGDEENEWENFEALFSRDVCSVFLMHPRCWDILLQQHALVESPVKPCLDLNALSKIFLQIPLGPGGSKFRPDWVTDYAGPELFFWNYEISSFQDAPEWEFMVHDPGFVRGFDDLLASPPLESVTDISPRIEFFDNGGDVFARLPEELLSEITMLLPSASVRDLRLASRRMASMHLSSRYSRSRFEFPNELCHVSLPPALLTSGQVGGQSVDWRRLCDQLMHPVGETFGWWQSRKRITALNKKLVESMSRRRSDGSLKGVDDV